MRILQGRSSSKGDQAGGNIQTESNLLRVMMGLLMLPAELQTSKEADLVVELLELPELETTSSVLGRTKPLMLMSSGEWEQRLQGKDAKSGKNQNLWEAAKGVLRRKFIAINACIKKQERSQINNLTLHLKGLEIDGKTNLKLVEERKQQRSKKK